MMRINAVAAAWAAAILVIGGLALVGRSWRIGARTGDKKGASVSCDALAEVPPSLLAPGRVVVLGEIHGTEEMPTAVGRLTCAAAKAGLHVTLALELPVTETEALRRFVLGKVPDESEVLAGNFWQSSFQSGQTSQAVLGLLFGARLLAQQVVGKIDVVAFVPAAKGEKPYEQVMAENIADAASAHSEGVVIALVGNTHARRSESEPRKMAWYLAQIVPSLVNLDVRHAGGTAWVCIGPPVPRCGPQQMGLGQEERRSPIVLGNADKSEFDGTIYLGAIRASPPAVGASVAQ